MHVKAFEAMNAQGALPCNVKFMLEGEEEIGSQNLGIFCKENTDKSSSTTNIYNVSVLSFQYIILYKISAHYK